MSIYEESVSCLTCNIDGNEGCKSCDFDEKVITCNSCLDTYYFDEENNVCLKCPAGCYTC